MDLEQLVVKIGAGEISAAGVFAVMRTELRVRDKLIEDLRKGQTHIEYLVGSENNTSKACLLPVLPDRKTLS